MATLVKIADPTAPRKTVLFVHGFGGDPYDTWRRQTSNVAWGDDPTFWPRWLADDCEGLAVYLIGYHTPISRWSGGAENIVDVAENILGRILTEPALADGSLIFIGHSLGGLVIKQLLRTAANEAHSRAGAADFIERVEEVVFLGTPHIESISPTRLLDRVRTLLEPSMASLVRNASFLRNLNFWYRNWTSDRHISHLVFAETQPTHVLGGMLQPDSSDTGLPGARSYSIGVDHINISKPVDQSSLIYRMVRDSIEKPNLRRNQMPKIESAPQSLEKGENRSKDLEDAVETYRRALVGQVGGRSPLDRAVTQNNLGLALVALGEREGTTERFDEAIEAYRAALELTREHAPRQWAAVQINLGSALVRLGEREGGTVRFEEAVEAYRAALTVLTHDREPQEWAATQNSLGLALVGLGQRESSTIRLGESIEAYRAALTKLTRDRVPLEWAATQNNLGSALVALGIRDGNSTRLDDAVTAYRESLTERTRERAPLQWAQTQNNLGNALGLLAGNTGRVEQLDQAIECYRAALNEYRRDRLPTAWAVTQNNLGDALKRRAEVGGDSIYLEEAVAAYSAALTEWTRDVAPFQWAQVQCNLGSALLELGERERGTASLEGAVAAFRAALEVTEGLSSISGSTARAALTRAESSLAGRRANA